MYFVIHFIMHFVMEIVVRFVMHIVMHLLGGYYDIKTSKDLCNRMHGK
jgi:hypothetical protein